GSVVCSSDLVLALVWPGWRKDGLAAVAGLGGPQWRPGSALPLADSGRGKPSRSRTPAEVSNAHAVARRNRRGQRARPPRPGRRAVRVSGGGPRLAPASGCHPAGTGRDLAPPVLDTGARRVRAGADRRDRDRLVAAGGSYLAADRTCEPWDHADLVGVRLHSQRPRVRAGRSWNERGGGRARVGAAEPLAPALGRGGLRGDARRLRRGSTARVMAQGMISVATVRSNRIAGRPIDRSVRRWRVSPGRAH